MKTQLYLFLFMLFGVTSNAQTPEQIEVFKKELLNACNEDKPNQLIKLYYTDGVDVESDENFIELWKSIVKFRKDKVIRRVDFTSKAEIEKMMHEGNSDTENYQSMYSALDESASIAKSGICHNLPLIGVVRIRMGLVSLILVVGVKDDKIFLPWFRPATQEERAEAEQIVKRRNPSLLMLKDSIDAANKSGKQVSLNIVTRGKGDALMVNRKEVAMTSMKEVILDLAKKAGDKDLIIVVDCGSKNKQLTEQLQTICDEGVIGNFSLITYQDTEVSDEKSQKPSVQPDDQE